MADSLSDEELEKRGIGGIKEKYKQTDRKGDFSILIQKYSGKILGSCGYKKDLNYYVEDLNNYDGLLHILGETFTRESDINIDGFNFIEERYGFDWVAEFLEELGGLDDGFRTKEEVLGWLKDVHNHFKNHGFQ